MKMQNKTKKGCDMIITDPLSVLSIENSVALIFRCLFDLWCVFACIYVCVCVCVCVCVWFEDILSWDETKFWIQIRGVLSFLSIYI